MHCLRLSVRFSRYSTQPTDYTYFLPDTNSGYITRDDHEESSPPHEDTEVEMETVQGPSLHPPEGWCSSNRGGGNGSRGGGKETVQARDGACATFILNFPMGNAPDTRTPPSSSSGTASTPSVSSSAASESVDLRSVPKEKSTPTYADKMRLIDENDKEVEMRLSRLSPSFDATQQVHALQCVSQSLT